MRSRLFVSTLILLALCVAVSGCGKSKKQLAQEAEQQRVAAQASAEASAAAASAAEARRADAERRQTHDAKVAELQSRLTQSLKDPASAQFREVHLNTPMTALCGQFNAKNSFGGYVGFREFIVTGEGIYAKPEGCGVMPLNELFSKSMDDATACLKFVQAEANDICK